jgi:hypothetical protein
MAVPAAVYRPRYPQATDYYRCVEDYFETFVRIYDEHFSRQYGFWRPYTSKDGRTSKSFPALEWLAAMCLHIPNRGEPMVRYYGYYSNVSRGKRQKKDLDDGIPCILDSGHSQTSGIMARQIQAAA